MKHLILLTAADLLLDRPGTSAMYQNAKMALGSERLKTEVANLRE